MDRKCSMDDKDKKYIGVQNCSWKAACWKTRREIEYNDKTDLRKIGGKD
jgi:hypothetical protein